MTPAGPSLWPREHGAYAQLGVALATALALGPVTVPQLAQAGLTVAAFLATEPLLHSLGRRPHADRSSRSALRVALLGSLAALLAVVAWQGAGRGFFPFLLVPGLPGAALLGLFLVRQEHTPWGEVLGAITFGASACPAILLGGRPPATALLAAGLLAVTFSLGSIAVRTLRRPANAGRARLWRSLPPLAVLGFMAVLRDLAEASVARPCLTWALLPMGLVTLALVFWTPRTFRMLGWLLTAGSLGTAAWIVVTLR